MDGVLDGQVNIISFEHLLIAALFALLQGVGSVDVVASGVEIEMPVLSGDLPADLRVSAMLKFLIAGWVDVMMQIRTSFNLNFFLSTEYPSASASAKSR